MKKLWIAVAAMTLIFALAACSAPPQINEDTAEQTEKSDPTPQPTEAPTPEPTPEPAPESTPESTPQVIEESDLLGFWHITEYNGEDVAGSCEFMEITEYETFYYKLGENIPLKDSSYGLDNNIVWLFGYRFNVTMDGDTILLAPEDPANPAMAIQRSTREEMDKIAVALMLPQPGHVVEIYSSDEAIASMILGKSWEQIASGLADGSYTMDVVEEQTFRFNSDGTFSDKRMFNGMNNGQFKGTYVVTDGVLTLSYASGNVHDWPVSLTEDQTLGKYFLAMSFPNGETKIYSAPIG